MKLLVTGAKGQVGSAICRLGVLSGFDVVGFDSSMLDIRQATAIEVVMATVKPDMIINAAAYTAVDKAETEPELARQVNALAAGQLARIAAENDVPLIHISTDYVFDGTKSGAYTESDQAAPLGVYGATKLEGEQLIERFHNRHIILRTSWVFGIEGKNFPKTMLKLAKERSELGVVSDQFGCPTFADDIVRAIFAIASKYQSNGSLPWGLYHYAGQKACSWYDFATEIFRIAHQRGSMPVEPKLTALTSAQYPTAAKRPLNSVLDCSKLLCSFPTVFLSDWPQGIECLLKADLYSE